jgi:outer membrane protein assembly factor BamB
MKLIRPSTILSLLLAASFSTRVAAIDWPQWRGPARDGHATDAPALSALPKEPKVLWRISIGGGFSSPVVTQGKLVYLDEQEGQEFAHALDAASGKELWRVSYTTSTADEWGAGPRSTPILDGDRVYAQACNGEFRCFKLADGKVVWQTSFEKDFGVKYLGSKANEGTASRRGNNGCGVIDGPRLILPVGSTLGASLVCFDKLTGKVLWKSGDDEAAYSSFMIATLAGVKQVVALTADALLGADLATGKILWRVPLKTNAKRHAASPVVHGDTVIVNSHSFGLVCFKIEKDSGGLKATEAWANKAMKINLSTPVLVADHLYCQGPVSTKDFVCVEAGTGKLAWSHAGFGKENSSTIVFDNRLLVLTDDGQLVLVDADSSGYTERGRLQVCGKNWNHPAFADGKLYVRDNRELICLDLVGSNQ